MMKKKNAKQKLTTPMSEGTQNIAFLLDFLANAKREFLLQAEIEELEKLERLIAASTDDELFASTFPLKDIDGFLNEHGKPLSYTHGDKCSHLRHSTIVHCARKAYDMLISAHSANELNYVDVERFAACDSLYDAVVAVTKPTSSAGSLKESLANRLDRTSHVY